MLDHHHRGALLDQVLEHVQQRAHVARVQADGRLVEHEQRAVLGFAHFAGQLQALRLAAGERRRCLAERKVPKPQVMQRLQHGVRLLQAGARVERLVDAHGHELRERVPVPGDGVGVVAVATAAAIGAGNVHVGKELHIKRHLAGAVAGGAAQLAGVVGERARLQARGFRLLGASERAAQVVEHPAVGGDGRAHVRTDGRCVDELRADDADGVDPAHAGGQCFACVCAVQGRNQLFEHERGLAASRYAGDRC